MLYYWKSLLKDFRRNYEFRPRDTKSTDSYIGYWCRLHFSYSVSVCISHRYLSNFDLFSWNTKKHIGFKKKTFKTPGQRCLTKWDVRQTVTCMYVHAQLHSSGRRINRFLFKEHSLTSEFLNTLRLSRILYKPHSCPQQFSCINMKWNSTVIIYPKIVTWLKKIVIWFNEKMFHSIC